MKIGPEGLALVKDFEGYGRKLPDGSCTAYQERINGKLDIPTIGYGCTRGVKMGMVWTQAEAEAKLLEELASHEARVVRLVTVELNQNQFDALVSFDYNTGGLHKSTLLRKLNKGDYDGAAAEFKHWNKFGGKPAKGLIRRRAAELALFMKPIEDIEPDYMPQEPEPSPAPMSPATVGTGGLAIGGTGAVVTTEIIKSSLADATQIKSSLKDLSPLPPITSAIWPAGAAAILIVVVLWILNRRSINV